MTSYESCVQACNACAITCETCAAACLREDDVGMMARCIRLDLDCAALCRLAALSMVRDSEFARDVCALCAQVCRACGEECGRHKADHCQRCAQDCRACAEACERMAA